MNPVLFSIGPVNIYWYSVFILLASLAAGYILFKEVKKNNIDEDKIVNMILFLIPIVLVGARLYFVIFNWDYYSLNPLSIFKVWEGGMAIHGGIIAGAIWIIYYTKKHKINTLKIMDIAAPCLLIGQAIGRWGNFFNSEAYGPITTYENLKSLLIPEFIIDGMKINGQYHQPTFLYESVWCLIGFLIIIFILKRIKKLKLGQQFSFYLFWYGIGRFFIEGLRTDSLMLGSLKMAQIVSLIMIALGVILFIIFQNKKQSIKNRRVKK